MPLNPCTLTVAWPDLVLSAALVAETVMATDGTRPGAVYNPVADIVPRPLFPPATPLTDQLTVVLLLLKTLAANCTVWPIVRLAFEGLTDTEMV
jgi:hypothetical protein